MTTDYINIRAVLKYVDLSLRNMYMSERRDLFRVRTQILHVTTSMSMQVHKWLSAKLPNTFL